MTRFDLLGLQDVLSRIVPNSRVRKTSKNG